MFLFLFFNPVFAASAPPTHATQLAALEDFYTALTHGEDWRITYNWNTGGGDFCKWHDEGGHGVTCDANGDVVSLVIPDNNAIGTLPDCIGNLTALKTLTVAGNFMVVGSMPHTIKALTALESFVLEGCTIDGTVPVGIGELTALTTLNLNYNAFAGIFPPIPNLHALTSLSMSGNVFDGIASGSCGVFAQLTACEIGSQPAIGINNGTHCPPCLNTNVACRTGAPKHDWPFKDTCHGANAATSSTVRRSIL